MTALKEKVLRKPATGLYPTPVVLVTSVDGSQRPNIITLAWAGVVCSEPPQIGIGVRPQRFSHALIEKSGQFVVNIPSEGLLHATDVCGTVSGRNCNKFAQAGLTPQPATQVRPPLIAECPVNLECVVRHKVSLGSHDLFIGEVVAVHVNAEVQDENERIDLLKAKPLVYSGRQYWGLHQMLQEQGFSVRTRSS